MRDPYQVLGITRAANEDDIKKAYRAMAKKYHPDLNPGKKNIESTFKEINAAHDILGDPEKRAKFDRGEIDNEGNARASGFRPRYSSGAGTSSQRPPRPEDFQNFGAEDIFADLFGGAKPRSSRFDSSWGQGHDPFGSAREKARGADSNETLHVSFVEAAMGAKKRINLATGKTIEISVPAGSESGNKLRLKGQGFAGLNDGQPGDALIDIQVDAHPFFTRKGQDVHLECPVTLYEAVAGGNVEVPTLDGLVELKIAKGSNTGHTLRLRGKGILDPQGTRGDQYIKLKIILPDEPDEQLAKFIDKWAKDHTYDPRKKAGLT